MAMYKSGPRYTSGIGALEVTSPELRKALGIEKPQQFDPKTLERLPREDETPRPFRPQGLGNIFLGEDKKQSAEARSMLGSGIMGQGVSPGFSQALTGSPVGATTQAEVLEALTNPQIIQDKASKIVDDFSEVNEASEINNKLQGLESDIVGIGTSKTDDFDAGLAESTGATDETAESTESTDTEENLTAAQTATKTALSEFLEQARPGIKPQNYDEYIKEFGEATGLDISGEPDTKQALMSFGLALMQNRAGKGFDLSKILTATGEAGEAAMPDFRKAVAEAKTVRAKAGEFAISRKKEDQTAAMNRSNYYIIPKGKLKGIKGLAQNFEKGENVMLNSYELNSLNESKKFNEQYEIVPSSIYKKAAEAYFKTPEYGEKYLAKRENISLFNDAPDDLTISIARVNQNYKGPDMPKLGFYNASNYEDDFAKLVKVDRSLDKIAKKIGTAFSITDEGRVDVPGQIADGVTGFARAFGIDMGKGGATDSDKVRYVLRSIAAQKAPQILGEAGKTISDADRERVQQIVGQLEGVQDKERLKLALKEVYELIVVEGKLDVQQGLTKLNRYAKRSLPKFDTTYNVAMGDDGVFDVRTQQAE